MLHATDLTVNYDGQRALSGVTIDVLAGELVAIIGANGAGKSTLLKALSGLQRPTGGHVTFNGTSITGLPAHQIARHGLICVPEGHRVVPRLTVKTNLQLGAYITRDYAAREETLALVMELFPILRQRLRQPAGTLSGGEQQMLALGRALMTQPTLLMLDEPTVGVAPKTAQVIFEAIATIHARGVPVLLVEQKITAALEIANRGYLLQTGTVVDTGTPDHLRRSPILHSSYLGI